MVERVNTLGTVFVLELAGDKGYLSNTSKTFIADLKEAGIYARPLGNVVYFMAGQKTTKEELGKVLQAIVSCLDRL